MRPRDGDDDDCRVCGVFIVTIVTSSHKSKKKGKNRLMIATFQPPEIGDLYPEIRRFSYR